MFYPAATGTYNLGSSIGSTDDSILLSSFKDPTTGVPITMETLGTDIAYGTIGPKTSSFELISFQGVSQNDDGSATLLNVTRGLARQFPFTEDSDYKLPHSGQSIFILSDAPQVWTKYPAKENDENITGLWNFDQSPTGINPGGVPDSSTTVKGIGEVSVAPVSPTEPIFVGDNDGRVGKPFATAFQKLLTDSSVSQNIAHGLGYAPRFVEATGTWVDETGAYVLTTNGIFVNGGNLAENGQSFTSSLQVASNLNNNIFLNFVTASGHTQQVTAVTVNSTNVTLTWVKTSSPTGSGQIVLKAW